MNQRQRAFAEVFAATGNAAEAARRAGYSPKTARAIGQKLLTKVDIMQYVQDIQSQASRERIANAAEIGSTLTGMLRDCSLAAGTRIKAANTLLKSQGAFLPPAPGGETTTDVMPDDENRVIVLLPYSPRDRAEPNAVQLPGGDVVPITGHERDDILIYAPFQLTSEADFAAKEDDEDERTVE